MKRYVHLDVGASDGGTVRKFLKGELVQGVPLDQFEVYAFEPDLKKHAAGWDALKAEYPAQSITKIDAAAWVYDGLIPFATVAANFEANTLLPDCESYARGEVSPVRCFDLAAWVVHHCSDADVLTMKLDVEGAEYALLERLLDQNVLHWFYRVWVEFHEFLLPAPYAARHARIVERSPVRLEGWG